MNTQLHTEYTLFVNAFSYSVASTVISSAIDEAHHSLLLLAVLMAVVVVALARMRDLLRRAAETAHSSAARGPLRLGLFLVSNLVTLTVSLVSLLLGKLVGKVADDVDAVHPTATTVTLVVTGLTLLWLLGAAGGVQ